MFSQKVTLDYVMKLLQCLKSYRFNRPDLLDISAYL